MLHCGSIDDVYAYEKLRRPTKEVSSPLSPIIAAKPRHKKAMSFSTSTAPDQSPPSAKLGAKKSISYRWITRHSSGTPGNSERRANTEDMKAPAALPPKKPKEPSKRVGFVDILLGYHSLLHASPAFPTAAQRREIHPTIGFLRNPQS